MRKITVFIFSVLFVYANSSMAEKYSQDNKYFKDRERGWFWYEDPKEEEKKEEEKLPPVAASQTKQSKQDEDIDPREIIKMQGEELEKATARAVLNPTPENVADYINKTSKVVVQGSVFADAFKEVIRQDPALDYTIENPVTPQAIVAKNEQIASVTEADLRSLSNESGIVFFFRGDCPFCHKFAPILKRFSEVFGFTVIPVSLDGGSLPEYPYPKQNYEIGKKLNVSVVPATFLVIPEKNTVSVIGYGFTDFTTYKDKVLTAAKALFSTETTLAVSN